MKNYKKIRKHLIQIFRKQKKYINKLFFSNIFYMYKEKYLKYKTKYLDLKSQLGGCT